MRLPMIVLLLPLAAAEVAAAQVSKVQVTVCDQDTVFIRKESNEAWSAAAHRVEVWRVPKELGEDPAASAPVLAASGAGIVLPDNPLALRADLDRGLSTDETLKIRVRDAAGVRVGEGDLATAAKATILPSRAAAEAEFRFDVRSPVHFQIPGNLVLIEVRSKATTRRLADGTAQNVDETRVLHPVTVHRAPLGPGCDAVTDPGRLGIVTVDLLPGTLLREGSAGLRLDGLIDAFGRPLAVTGDLVPAKTPKGKEDATIYTRVSFESAKGAPDSFAVDLKVQPTLAQFGRVLFRPELTAAVAKNVPGASNSIRLALLLSQATSRRATGAVLFHSFSYGPAIESDRNFDRVNAIADLRWQPVFRGFNRSRELQRIEDAAALGKKLEEVVLKDFGWGLETWLGLEAGGSLSRQTVQNRARTAGIEVERYEVLRLRPVIHGFLEYRQLTLDATANLRYLATEELMVREMAGVLSVEEVDGFEPFSEATLSYAFDPAKHISLALTWKDGAEPPLFVDVEKYSLGLVVKY